MSDHYTHTNGHTITHRDGGIVRIESTAGDYTYLAKDETDALRDYLLGELGLWRDDETGALVVTGSWDGSSARVIALPDDGDDHVYAPPLGILDSDAPDRYDAVVTRWRATLAPPTREPQPGEVWRITLEDGTERTALVDTDEFNWVSDLIAVADIPSDRRRILAEADGTVVSDD